MKLNLKMKMMKREVEAIGGGYRRRNTRRKSRKISSRRKSRKRNTRRKSRKRNTHRKSRKKVQEKI